MSSEVATATTSQQTQGGDTSAQLSSGADLAKTGYKYQAGAGVPDWLVGKTAAEAAAIASQLYNVAASGAQTRPQQPTPQPQQFAPASAPTGLPSNDDWLSDPNAALQRAAQVNFQPYFEQMAAGQAATARALAEQRYADDFRRFGPEIVARLATVPAQMQTFDNISTVVDMVRGKHANELAAELAEQKLQERIASGTLRPAADGSGGLAPSPNDALSLEKAELSPEYAHVLRLRGVDDKTLDRFLRQYYGPDVDLVAARKDWIEKAKAGQVINEGSGWQRLMPVGGAK